MTPDDGIHLLELLDVPFDFERQPDPVPAALRPERRVPLVLLLVAKSHGAGASWKGLQLLNWAVRDPERSRRPAGLGARPKCFDHQSIDRTLRFPH